MIKRYIAVLFVTASAFAQPAYDLQAEVNRTDRPLTRAVRVAGTHTLTQSLVIPSNVSILCAEGTVIEGAPGSFKESKDVDAASLLVITGVENVQIIGCTFRLQGSAYYRDPANGYDKSEFRHCARVTGSKNVTFQQCRFEKSGGDGGYVGPLVLPGSRTPCTNVQFLGCVFADNHRQGLSVVAGSATVEDCLFTGTQGTSPQAGFDAEPATIHDAVDVVVRRSHSEKNRGPAWMVGLFASNPTTTPPSRVIFEDVTYSDVKPDQPAFRLGGLISDEYIEGVTARGLPHKNLPKGTFISLNGVILVDRK